MAPAARGESCDTRSSSALDGEVVRGWRHRRVDVGDSGILTVRWALVSAVNVALVACVRRVAVYGAGRRARHDQEGSERGREREHAPEREARAHCVGPFSAKPSPTSQVFTESPWTAKSVAGTKSYPMSSDGKRTKFPPSHR